MEISLRGIGVSPGIAIGPAVTHGVQTLDIPKYEVEDPDAELERFNRAVEAVRADLAKVHGQMHEKVGAYHSGVFSAHLLILDDVAIREEVQSRLRSDRVNIEYLVDEIISRYSQALETMDDPTFRERASDVMDVHGRIMRKLLQAEEQGLSDLPRPCVIVAHDLSPSDTANLDTEKALGIATDVSGPTSHTAILARALEIPTVVALKYVGSHVTPDDMMIIDGTEGYVVIRPAEATLAQYRERQARVESERRTLLEVESHRPATTLDGHEIPVVANIELPIEVAHAIKVNALGVGLYRTEYLFLNRTTLPTEEEQLEAYSRVAAAVKPHPVTLRTLDLGGDKFMSHLDLAPEINPQLGWRAVRFCLERQDIFKTQLRAMLRASMHGNVRIMFPMISGLTELRQVRKILDEVRRDLDRRGVAYADNIPVGSMIEVPSAVIVAEELARECDFFSVGTNDLIQYSLAVDRGNEKIAHMYEPAHPAVMRMLWQTVTAADKAGIPCSICGEMAGDPLFTELLIGLGFDSLSMSAVAIPAVRAEIASTKLSLARRLVKRVLRMGTVEEVRDALRLRFARRSAVASVLSQAAADTAPDSGRE